MSYSLPDRAPLFQRPPYIYKGFRKISALCRTDMAALKRALPPRLQPISDIIEIFVMDVPDAGSLGSYREGGIVANVGFGPHTGGHVLYEFVTSDDSMAAGREIWGYPKKIADVHWKEAGHTVSGRVKRRGAELIDIVFSPADNAFERPVLQPRLQIKRFPAADGNGDDLDRVILNELQAGKVHQSTAGNAQVRLGGNEQDPLHELPLIEVIGADFIVADFVLEFGRTVG